MADRLVVLQAGVIQQVGTPEQVYEAPANRFVAGFVGASVEIPGRIVATADGRCDVALEGGACFAVENRFGLERDASVVVSARPEHLMLFDDPAPDRLPAELRQSAPIGGTVVHDVSVGTRAMKVTEPRSAAIRAPGPVHVGLSPTARPALFSSTPSGG